VWVFLGSSPTEDKKVVGVFVFVRQLQHCDAEGKSFSSCT
jgi:hypothetical protein